MTGPDRLKVDLDLWVRFMERLIERTESGAVKWEMRYSGEYERYAVCHVLDCELWFVSRELRVDVVEVSGMRWSVPNVPEQSRNLSANDGQNVPRIRRLARAIGDQLSPGHIARVESFAHEFLGEEPQ